MIFLVCKGIHIYKYTPIAIIIYIMSGFWLLDGDVVSHLSFFCTMQTRGMYCIHAQMPRLRTWTISLKPHRKWTIVILQIIFHMIFCKIIHEKFTADGEAPCFSQNCPMIFSWFPIHHGDFACRRMRCPENRETMVGNMGLIRIGALRGLRRFFYCFEIGTFGFCWLYIV